jgi:hypothetical protein
MVFTSSGIQLSHSGYRLVNQLMFVKKNQSGGSPAGKRADYFPLRRAAEGCCKLKAIQLRTQCRSCFSSQAPVPEGLLAKQSIANINIIVMQ